MQGGHSKRAVSRTGRPARAVLAGLLATGLVVGIAPFVAKASMPDTPVPADPLPLIVVETDQPRYVAPTLRDRIGRIWAPVYINEKGPFRLVLDTGANRSAIIDRVATSLNPAGLGQTGNAARTNAQLRGTTGSAVVPMIDVEELRVGDLLIGATQLPILPDALGGADGVLGYDGLQDKRIFIDFANDLITIKRSHRERPDRKYIALPMDFVHEFVPAINVAIGGKKVKAIIDTGAQRSIGNRALFDLLKRSNHHIDKATITGVTLDDYVGDAVRVANLRMGALYLPELRLTFGDIYIFDYWKLSKQPAIILGMDVLGTVDKLVIDYRRREVHLKTRAPT